MRRDAIRAGAERAVAELERQGFFADGPFPKPAASTMTPEDLQLLQPEKDFMQQILDLARLSGWLCFHVMDSRGSLAGFPDLCLVKGGRLVFAECKSMKGRVSRAQEHWLAQLGAVQGITVAIWRPGDWAQIEAMLTGRAA